VCVHGVLTLGDCVVASVGDRREEGEGNECLGKKRYSLCECELTAALPDSLSKARGEYPVKVKRDWSRAVSEVLKMSADFKAGTVSGEIRTIPRQVY
jgi:hypothetical protein